MNAKVAVPAALLATSTVVASSLWVADADATSRERHIERFASAPADSQLLALAARTVKLSSSFGEGTAMIRRLLFGLVTAVTFAAATLLYATPAAAAEVTARWTGGGSTNNWSEAANWSGGVVPNNGAPGDPRYRVVINPRVKVDVRLNLAVTIDALTIGAGQKLTVVNGRGLTVATGGTPTPTISNAGTIALNSTGATTELRIFGNVSLGGGGALTMSDNEHNRIIGQTGAERLTNIDNTISGSGAIGADAMSLTNQGTILATGAVGLVVDANADGAINNGTMRAAAGSSLAIRDTHLDNAGGLVRASSTGGHALVYIIDSLITGGTVDLTGTWAGEVRLTNGILLGGSVTNNSSGTIRAESGTSRLSGLVTNPAGGSIVVDNGSTLILDSAGVYNNAGRIALNSTGLDTDLRIDQDVTVKGTGTIALGNSVHNRIRGLVTGAEVFTNAGNTISGGGRIGAGFLNFVNKGTLVANAATPMTIDTTTTFANMGAVRIAAGHTLQMGAGDNYTQTKGSTLADGTLSGTGQVLLSGGVLSGTGTIAPKVINGSGSIRPGDPRGTLHMSADYLDSPAAQISVELDGRRLPNYDQMTVAGTVTLASALHVSVGFASTHGDKFRIIANGGTDAVAGTFAGLPENATFAVGARTFRITYHGGDGNDVVLTNVT
jgi:fibronectin-binding autotransporter adhesin